MLILIHFNLLKTKNIIYLYITFANDKVSVNENYFITLNVVSKNSPFYVDITYCTILEFYN